MGRFFTFLRTPGGGRGGAGRRFPATGNGRGGGAGRNKMFERYTEKARRVIFFARYEASQFGSPYIETEHLLLGLLREDKALTNRFLRQHSSVDSIRKQIEAHTTVREKVSTSVDLPLSNECKRVLAYAARRGRAAQPQAHWHRAPAAWAVARREMFCGRDSGRARAEARGDPRGTAAHYAGEGAAAAAARRQSRKSRCWRSFRAT